MKIKFQGTMKDMFREGTGDVRINFVAKGTVQDARGGPEAKEATVNASILLRFLHAENIRFGQKLTITVDTDEDQ